MKNLYFNGHYIIRGYKIFGTIYGRIIYSQNEYLFTIGEKVKMKSTTFTRISESHLKTLKDFGFIDSEQVITNK